MTEEIEELIEIIRDNSIDDKSYGIYQQIRKQILKELKFSDLSMIRLLKLMLELYWADRKLFEIVLVFMSHPMQSMRDLGQQFGVDKSTAWRALRRAAGIHPEIALLLEIRLREVKQGPQRNDVRMSKNDEKSKNETAPRNRINHLAGGAYQSV